MKYALHTSNRHFNYNFVAFEKVIAVINQKGLNYNALHSVHAPYSVVFT